MFERFTEKAVQVMMIAQERAKYFGASFVGTEHILLGILEEETNVAARALVLMGVTADKVRQEIEKGRGGISEIIRGSIPFTPRAKHVIELAWDEARAIGHNYVNVEHLLLGLLREKESTASRMLASMGVDLAKTKEAILRILGESISKVAPRGKMAAPTPALDSFGRDLTQLAREGKLDPVVGREEEIQRVIQILSRRTKNNPVLTGEAGVGKTAIVEGLAQRIINREVPPPLMNRRIVALDLGLLVAGTRFRGEFEERLKKVMDELKKIGNIILMIDELHTIIGAGSAEGTLDAANMFKPALARGEMQCIGATTLDEYHQYIEEDAALERRFQAVFVDEPTEEETVSILKGLRQRYEEFHGVKITDQAIEVAARLSKRYVPDRFLPDKAIDLVDEAASRVMLAASKSSPKTQKILQELEELRHQKEEAISHQSFEEAAKFRDQENELRAKLDNLGGPDQGERLVTDGTIAEIVASWTGIPVVQLTTEETKRLLEMEKHLEETIIGQNEAIKALARSIRRARAGLKDPKRPTGSFVFLGPTGVGKTALAKALARFLFGDEEAIVRIDMSEYTESHTVSRLTGSPPGYVGYDEGGQLTEAVRRRPYSIVLFDEIEKANREVSDVFLQILEEGRLTDGKGRLVDFRNCVIIMTSNVGARSIIKDGTVGFITDASDKASYDKMKEKLLEELKKEFKPEFLNRIDDLIVFRSLAVEDLTRIADLMVDEVNSRLKEQNITLAVSAKVKKYLAEKSFDPHQGARPLRRLIQEQIEDALAEEIIKGRFPAGAHLTAGLDGQRVFFKEVKKGAQPAAKIEAPEPAEKV